MPDILSNLIGHWKLDETSGTSAADQSGNGYAGTYARAASNTTIASAGGQLASGYSANGTSDRIGTSAVIPAGPMTISFWAKFLSADVSGGAVLRDNTTLQVYRASTTLYWDYGGFSPGVNRISTSIAAVDDQWTHYVLTSTGTSGSPRMEMFFNKVSAASGNYASQPSGSSSQFAIASHPDTSSKSKCQIDDVRVYSRVLSGADIAALYDLGKPQFTVAPAIAGDAEIAQTLTVSHSATDGTATYQWTRDGGNIGGAAASTYDVTLDDVGTTIACVVTRTNSIGASTQTAPGVGPVPSPSSARPRCGSLCISLPVLGF